MLRPIPQGGRQSEAPMSLIVHGATILDAISDAPNEGQSILIEDGRIQAIDARSNLRPRLTAHEIDASGKYAIPGLLNANVHLLGDARLQNLAMYVDRL